MNYQPKLHALVLRGGSLKNYPYISIKFDPSQIGHLKWPLNPAKAHHPQTVIPLFFSDAFWGARFCTVRRLSWGETTHILAFPAPQRMQHDTFFTEKNTRSLFGARSRNTHVVGIRLNQFSCGIYFLRCEICQTAKLELHCCVSMVFLKHQHDTSNPFGNLLPQHHFDEASFNPINKNSTRGLPRKRIISKKPSETHSPNNVGSCCYLYTPFAVSMSNLGSTNIRIDCRKNL